MVDKPLIFYEFGSFRLSPAKRTLFKAGVPIDHGSKAFETLLTLVENAGAPVSKDQLLNRVWPDAVVEENNLNQCVSAVRKALGDSPDAPLYIKTIPGKGYAFVSTVKKVPERRPNSKWLVAGISALGVTIAISATFFIFRSGEPAEEAISTQSREARERYNLALGYEEQGDDEQALKALQEATAADKNFAEALLEEASIYSDMDETAKARDFAERAEKSSLRLSEPRKLLLKGILSELAGEQNSALESYQLLVDEYPKFIDGYRSLAAVAVSVGRITEAKQAVEKCMKLAPTNADCIYQNFMVEIRRNQFDTVKSSIESLRGTKGFDPWLEEPLALAYWGAGDLGNATIHLEDLKNAGAGTVKFHGNSALASADDRLVDIALYQGRINFAKEELERMRKDADSKDVQAGYLLYLASVEAYLGELAKAKDAANDATRISEDPLTTIKAARVLAIAGAADKAEMALARWETGRNGTLEGTMEDHFIKGESALTSGRSEEATREFLLVLDAQPEDKDLEVEYSLAQSYLVSHHWQDAAGWLEKLSGRKGEILLDYTPLIWPLVQLQLSFCYEKMGRKAEGAESYSNFSNTWNNADLTTRKIIEDETRVAILGKR